MDEYSDWTIGEIIDSMIRVRVKGNLSFAEKKEYNGLVEELDRRFAFLAPEPEAEEEAEEEPEEEAEEQPEAEPEGEAESESETEPEKESADAEPAADPFAAPAGEDE